MWLAVVGAPVMFALGGYDYYRASKLKNDGFTVTGTLVDSSMLDTGKGRTGFRITLDYKPPDDASTYRKEFAVSQATFEQARELRELPVRYLPSDPTVSAVGDDAGIDPEPFAIGAGLIVFALAVWAFLRWQSARVEAYVTGDV